MENTIPDRIKQIRERIADAAIKSGRPPEEIRVIAVTKNVSIEEMEKVYAEKIHDFAENKVQELIKKYDIFIDRARWHFIGRLQTNKVKYLIDKVDLIHSVDRIDLLQEIDKRAAQINKIVDVLIQVNLSGELSKSGIHKHDLLRLLLASSQYEHIRIKGLMTMAPFQAERNFTRCIFSQLRNLAIDIKMENIHNVTMDFLSMGMSGDFEIAIEEGSNIVRLGTAIFT